MVIGSLPGDGELRLGPVTLPAGRVLPTNAPQPAVWATSQAVPQPGRVWSQLSVLRPDTGLVPILLSGLLGSPKRPWDSGEHGAPRDLSGLDDLDAADVLAGFWHQIQGNWRTTTWPPSLARSARGSLAWPWRSGTRWATPRSGTLWTHSPRPGSA
jgi:hypothetical protein